MPYAIRRNKKGQTTIENLALDRKILNDVRLEHLQKMKLIHQIIQIAVEDTDNQELQIIAQQAKENLEHAVSDQAEFAAATRAALKQCFELFI
jgi:hypothetical protein